MPAAEEEKCKRTKEVLNIKSDEHLHVEAREAGVHDKVPVIVAVALGDAVKKSGRFLTHHQFAGNCQDARSPVSAQLLP